MKRFEITVEPCFSEDRDIKASMMVNALSRELALMEFYASEVATAVSDKAYELRVVEIETDAGKKT